MFFTYTGYFCNIPLFENFSSINVFMTTYFLQMEFLLINDLIISLVEKKSSTAPINKLHYIQKWKNFVTKINFHKFDTHVNIK